jgi:hypothetical protein
MFHLADLGVTLPPELAAEFLGKLCYVSEHLAEFELTKELNAVRFQLSAGDHDNEASVIAERFSQIARKMCDVYRPAEARVLASRKGYGVFDLDPQPLLQARGELVQAGQGRFGFGPRLLGLMEFFDRRIVSLAQLFSAETRQFPTLIAAEVLDRCKYLGAFPHSVSVVLHLREDLDAIQNFARTARWDGHALVCDAKDFSPVQCLLSPTICFHCFGWLQDTCQPEPKAFTAVGKCFRYESRNLNGLERLWDFTMREIIFVGAREYVLEQRQRTIDQCIELLQEWDLTYKIKSATDAFFLDESSMATFQLAFDLKYEVQAPLPYQRKTVAIGSFNFHQDLFGRSMNISTANREPANTGCVGFGIERLALAFLAQHGLDAKRWPSAVANNIKSW